MLDNIPLKARALICAVTCVTCNRDNGTAANG